jgi:hypothetical protein
MIAVAQLVALGHHALDLTAVAHGVGFDHETDNWVVDGLGSARKGYGKRSCPFINYSDTATGNGRWRRRSHISAAVAAAAAPAGDIHGCLLLSVAVMRLLALASAHADWVQVHNSKIESGSPGAGIFVVTENNDYDSYPRHKNQKDSRLTHQDFSIPSIRPPRFHYNETIRATASGTTLLCKHSGWTRGGKRAP